MVNKASLFGVTFYAALAQMAFGQSSPCIQVPIQPPKPSFDAGINFEGQRTYILHGDFQISEPMSDQCVEIRGLDVHPISSVQSLLGVTSIRLASNQTIGVEILKTDWPNDVPRISFRLTSPQSIKKLSYVVMVAGDKSGPSQKELNDALADLHQKIAKLNERLDDLTTAIQWPTSLENGFIEFAKRHTKRLRPLWIYFDFPDNPCTASPNVSTLEGTTFVGNSVPSGAIEPGSARPAPYFLFFDQTLSKWVLRGPRRKESTESGGSCPIVDNWQGHGDWQLPESHGVLINWPNLSLWGLDFTVENDGSLFYGSKKVGKVILM